MGEEIANVELSEAVNKPFIFHGEGGEYFRVWIVNIFLSILTLGIYSAWATVRTKRYFYGNTELDGDRFYYLGEPLAILRGRILALVFFLLYQVLVSLVPLAIAIAVTIVFIVSLPWIVSRALAFNAQMSSWRGIRFGFDGDWVGAAKAYVFWPGFGFATLGLGLPYAWYKQNQFLISNYRFGASSFLSTARGQDFFGIAFAIVAFAFCGALFSFPLLMVSDILASLEIAGAEAFSTVILAIGYFTFYLMIYALYQAVYFRTVYNNIHIQQNKFATSVAAWNLGKVFISNAFLILITLGFYIPWAKVRMTRYLQANLWVDAIDLESFVAKSGDSHGALGEELGEAFDLGVGI